jgi:signal transduction histidine kinase
LVLKEPVGECLDLKVSATGFCVGEEQFTVCVLKDISQQKRLGVLNRTFFHDVINTAGGIRGFTELLRYSERRSADDEGELAELHELADQLLEEIEAQRDLMYAESGDLEPDFAPLRVPALLGRLQTLYRKHPVAQNRHLLLGQVWDGDVQTDQRLLARVLGNMIKNALEATPPGGTVTVRCSPPSPQGIVLSVHNEGVMPKEIQTQIFQRSFSTKANSGRGIGTHSMKLLGERYLGGKVAFTSCDPDGTTFTLTLPPAGRPPAP